MRSLDAVAVMPCPICKTGLSLSDRQGIEIDFCPTCRGVWLDRGELDKIIERTITDATTARREYAPDRSSFQRSMHDDDDDHRYRQGRRKKSFLSELFD